MAFNYGTNMGAGIGAGTAGGFSGSGGGGGGFWNWGNFTNTNSKYWDPKPGLANTLGKVGAAISPEGSWQQKLGATAAKTGQQEQGRRYLAELLAGTMEDRGVLPEKTGGEEEKKSKPSELMDLGSILSGIAGFDYGYNEGAGIGRKDKKGGTK